MTAPLAGRSVLFVTQYYRPELIGSAPFLGDLAEAMAASGARTLVLTSRPHYPEETVFAAYRDGGRDRERLAGVAIERLPTWVPRGGSALRRIAAEAHFLLQGAVALARGRVRRRPIVLSLCPSILAVLAGALAKSPGGRHVAVVHDIQSGLAEGLGMVGGGLPVRLMRGLETAVLNRVDHVLVLSGDMRDRLVRQGVTTSIDVAPIWVDTEAIHPLRAPEGSCPTVLYSGNMGRKQGLWQVIEMAARLREIRPDIPVVLRGEGNQAAPLRAAVRERGLDNVAFLPLLAVERLNQGLNEGDIHLVPQNPDAADFAVPSKIFSIMAAARPFVATARPGSGLARLEGESGAFVCVPPGAPDAFADAVRDLAEDIPRRRAMGARGRQYVLDHCSRTRVLNDLLATVEGEPDRRGGTLRCATS